MSNRNTWFAIPASLIAIVAIFSCLDGVLKQRAAEQPHGRFTVKGIIDRTRGLQTLSLLPQSLSLTATQKTFYTKQGQTIKLWIVEGSDGSDRQPAGVQWDGDTGELILLCRTASDSSASAPDLTRAQAISRTWLLLRQRNVGLPVGPWKLSVASGPADDCWHVHASSVAARGALTIDKHSGQVTFIHFTSAPFRKKLGLYR